MWESADIVLQFAHAFVNTLRLEYDCCSERQEAACLAR